MEERIISIISEITRKPLEYLQQNQTGQKFWDSLQLVEIVLAIEEEFDIMFYPEEIKDMNDLHAILSMVKRKSVE
ncbi:MAG: acyl carrier protein [Clostridiaceae bacterium]|nr:acyl carrier protein [Clostridiaceae bacterium]